MWKGLRTCFIYDFFLSRRHTALRQQSRSSTWSAPLQEIAIFTQQVTPMKGV